MPAERRCADCAFTTRWMLDLWEHRLQTGHMEHPETREAARAAGNEPLALEAAP